MAVKWYEFEMANGKKCRIANPSFSKADSFSAIDRWNVTESEFNRVLAEWEADQQATKPDSQQQWVPKVGDWVRVKESAPTDKGALFQVKATWGAGVFLPNGSAINNDWLEPAEPQLIDKLGWWLVGGVPDCFIMRDGKYIGSENDSVSMDDNAKRYGVFIAEITDEEIAAYHRQRIVPKCPVEVQS